MRRRGYNLNALTTVAVAAKLVLLRLLENSMRWKSGLAYSKYAPINSQTLRRGIGKVAGGLQGWVMQPPQIPHEAAEAPEINRMITGFWSYWFYWLALIDNCRTHFTVGRGSLSVSITSRRLPIQRTCRTHWYFWKLLKSQWARQLLFWSYDFCLLTRLISSSIRAVDGVWWALPGQGKAKAAFISHLRHTGLSPGSLVDGDVLISRIVHPLKLLPSGV